MFPVAPMNEMTECGFANSKDLGHSPLPFTSSNRSSCPTNVILGDESTAMLFTTVCPAWIFYCPVIRAAWDAFGMRIGTIAFTCWRTSFSYHVVAIVLKSAWFYVARIDATARRIVASMHSHGRPFARHYEQRNTMCLQSASPIGRDLDAKHSVAITEGTRHPWPTPIGIGSVHLGPKSFNVFRSQYGWGSKWNSHRDLLVRFMVRASEQFQAVSTLAFSTASLVVGQ